MKKMNFAKNLLKIAAVASLSVVLTGCGRSDVNVNDYVTLEYEGYDSLGTAVCTIDFEKMIDENLKAFDLDEDSSDKAYNSVLKRLTENFSGELDKTTELSNGDKITFEWDKVDIEELEEIFPVKLTVSDKSITVDGLEEPEKFDPFEFVTVTYEGIAPGGSVRINVESGLPVSGINFTADKSNGLSNGDKIKITASSYYDELEDLCIQYGMYPVNTEKEYTVEGLSSYASKLADIPQESMDKLDAHAQDSFNAYVAQDWDDPSGMLGIKLIGNYFLAPKDPSIITYTKNYVYFIYEITAKDPETEEEFTYYYYSSYTDVMILDDGTCSFDLGTLNTPSGSAFFGSVSGEGFIRGEYFYKGYEDLDTLFNKHVTANIDSYSYESTVE